MVVPKTYSVKLRQKETYEVKNKHNNTLNVLGKLLLHGCHQKLLLQAKVTGNIIMK